MKMIKKQKNKQKKIQIFKKQKNKQFQTVPWIFISKILLSLLEMEFLARKYIKTRYPIIPFMRKTGIHNTLDFLSSYY